MAVPAAPAPFSVWGVWHLPKFERHGIELEGDVPGAGGRRHSWPARFVKPIAIARAPFLWVGKLFALAGLLLILRGLVGSVLILRPR